MSIDAYIDFRKIGKVIYPFARRYYTKKDNKERISSYNRIVVNQKHAPKDFEFPSRYKVKKVAIKK